MTNPANTASREARALAEAVRAMVLAENEHARRTRGDIAAGRHRDGTTSRDDTDLRLMQIYEHWPVSRLDALLALADEAASQPREGFDAWIERYVGKQNAAKMRFSVEELRVAFDAGAALHDTAPTDQAQGGGEVERLREVLRTAYQWMNDYPDIGTHGILPVMGMIRAALAQRNPTDGGMAS